MLGNQKIRLSFHLLGYDEDKIGTQVLPVLINVLGVALCINAGAYIIHNRGRNVDATDVLIAAKDMNMILSVSACTIEYMFAKNHMKNLLYMIEKGFSKYGHDFLKTQKDLITKNKIDEDRILNKTGTLLLIIVCVFSLIPGLVTTVVLIGNGIEDTDVKKLPLPFQFQYPLNYDTLEIYVMVYLLQTVFVVYAMALGYCLLGSVSSSIQSVVTDINLFCIDLSDIDAILGRCENTLSYRCTLKNYTNYLIRNHQQIQRNVKVLSRSVSWVVTVANQNICFQICIYLYSTAEVDNKLAKLGYCTLILSLSVALFIYCRIGQSVVDISENLRISLYKCAWLDKPVSFKRDIRLMMTVANRPLQVKPLGLYVLDLRTFSNIINAAYSYFNVLQTVRK